jgi:hypothetical protein
MAAFVSKPDASLAGKVEHACDEIARTIGSLGLQVQDSHNQPPNVAGSEIDGKKQVDEFGALCRANMNTRKWGSRILFRLLENGQSLALKSDKQKTSIWTSTLVMMTFSHSLLQFSLGCAPSPVGLLLSRAIISSNVQVMRSRFSAADGCSILLFVFAQFLLFVGGGVGVLALSRKSLVPSSVAAAAGRFTGFCLRHRFP